MIAPISLDRIQQVEPIPAQDVARAVALMPDARHRRLGWFIHWQSRQPGGLQAFACDLINANLETRIGTPTMHALGWKSSTVFEGESFEAICEELNWDPLGERRHFGIEDAAASLLDTNEAPWRPDRIRRARASVFFDRCCAEAATLPLTLRKWSLDHRAMESGVRYMRDLIGAVEEAIVRAGENCNSVAASTKTAERVADALNFAHASRGLVVVFGSERLGKSKAAQRWAHANADKCRLVSLTAAMNDRLFYEEIAVALGCETSSSMTASDLRQAVRETVRGGDLMVIFDEAHSLFGVSAKASIKRLEYVRTELFDRGVPIALIVTPQFAERLMSVERATEFNLNQFRGRVTKWAELSSKVSLDDLETVARFYCPYIDAVSLEIVTSGAQAADSPLAALHNTIHEARALAHKNGQQDISAACFKQAVGLSLWTTSRLSATIPQQESRGARRRPLPVRVSVPQESTPRSAGNAVATPPPRAGNTDSIGAPARSRTASPALV